MTASRHLYFEYMRMHPLILQFGSSCFVCFFHNLRCCCCFLWGRGGGVGVVEFCVRLSLHCSRLFFCWSAVNCDGWLDYFGDNVANVRNKANLVPQSHFRLAVNICHLHLYSVYKYIIPFVRFEPIRRMLLNYVLATLRSASRSLGAVCCAENNKVHGNGYYCYLQWINELFFRQSSLWIRVTRYSRIFSTTNCM